MSKQGTTRSVWFTARYAIKIPRLVEWRLLLYGLLANMQEAQFWKHLRSEKLCPVAWSCPGGFLLIMARAIPLTVEEFATVDVQAFRCEGAWIVPVEEKQDSFGWYEGRLVAVDYGT